VKSICRNEFCKNRFSLVSPWLVPVWKRSAIMSRFKNSLLLSYIYHIFTRYIQCCLSAWSQFAEPSGGLTGTAGIMPRGWGGRDRAGDYRGYQKTVMCKKGLYSVGKDCGGWPQTASTRDDRRVQAGRQIMSDIL